MEKKIEVAYRKPGEGWKRKTVKETRLEQVVDKLIEDGAEVMTRDEDNGSN